jgi:hypothetical protein
MPSAPVVFAGSDKTAATGIFFPLDPKAGQCSTPSFTQKLSSWNSFACLEGVYIPTRALQIGIDALRQWVARGDLYTPSHITCFHGELAK